MKWDLIADVKTFDVILKNHSATIIYYYFASSVILHDESQDLKTVLFFFCILHTQNCYFSLIFSIGTFKSKEGMLF